MDYQDDSSFSSWYPIKPVKGILFGLADTRKAVCVPKQVTKNRLHGIRKTRKDQLSGTPGFVF